MGYYTIAPLKLNNKLIINPNSHTISSYEKFVGLWETSKGSTIEKILQELEAHYKKQVVLAGGYLRDAYFAGHPIGDSRSIHKDVDFFILDTPKGIDESYVRNTVPWGHVQGVQITPYHKVSHVTGGHGFFTCPVRGSWVRKACSCEKSKNTKWDVFRNGNSIISVQFIATRHTSMKDLLDSFDWDVCRFGFTLDEGFRFDCEKPLSRELELNPNAVIASPMHTLRRGFEFEKKLGKSMTPKGVYQLASLLALGGNS